MLEEVAVGNQSFSWATWEGQVGHFRYHFSFFSSKRKKARTNFKALNFVIRTASRVYVQFSSESMQFPRNVLPSLMVGHSMCIQHNNAHCIETTRKAIGIIYEAHDFDRNLTNENICTSH